MDKNRLTLPLRGLKEIPKSKEGAADITALIKKQGRTMGYQLSDGRTVDKEQGVLLAKKGEIRGVAIAVRKGSEYLKSVPDGEEQNNLQNLPSIPE